MNWADAKALARAGSKIRRTGWVDRWWHYDRCLFWLTPFDPVQRTLGTPHVLLASDVTRAEFEAVDWTTEEIPSVGDLPGGFVLGDTPQTVADRPVNFSVDITATVDGSDFFHLRGDQLWIVHRNWLPITSPLTVAFTGPQVNQSLVINPESAALFILPLSTSGLTLLSLTKLAGRGDVTLEQSPSESVGGKR